MTDEVLKVLKETEQWVVKALHRLAEIVALHDDSWEPNGPDTAAAEHAECAMQIVLTLARYDEPRPTIVTKDDGSISFEWRQGDLSFCLQTTRMPDKMTAIYEDCDGTDEWATDSDFYDVGVLEYIARFAEVAT